MKLPDLVETTYPAGAALAWAVLVAVTLTYCSRRLREQRQTKVAWEPSYMELTLLWSVAAVMWWLVAGGFLVDRIVPVAAASILGLSSGTLLGFVFTSYSEESQSVGKVRDWLLAGLATLSLAELATGADHVRRLLTLFADPITASIGVALASIVAFAVLGFMGSFILRELVLNISFARARSERKRLESALSDVQGMLKSIVSERSQLLTQYRDGAKVTPETHELAQHVVSIVKASKICVETLPKDQALAVAECLAILDHLAQAAGVFECVLERFGFDEQAIEGAVSCYEQLKSSKAAAAMLEEYKDQLGDYVNQWLGYYLLWDVTRLEDAVRYSQLYLAAQPDDPSTLFNLACGYAQLFALDRTPSHRDKALQTLGVVWDKTVEYHASIRKLFVWDGDFFVFANDDDFKRFRT